MAPSQVKKTTQVPKATKAYPLGSPTFITKPSSSGPFYPSLQTPRSPKYVQKKLVHAMCKDCYKPKFSPPWVRTGAALKEHPYGLETDYDDKLDWAGWKYSEAKQIGPVLQKDGYFYRPTEEWPWLWLFRPDIDERRVPWKLDPLSPAARKVYCYGTRDMIRRQGMGLRTKTGSCWVTNLGVVITHGLVAMLALEAKVVSGLHSPNLFTAGKSLTIGLRMLTCGQLQELLYS